MPDHSAPSEVSTPSELVLDDRQMKLLLHQTRKQIIDLLTERPATTSQLADALDMPKGTVGHHCQQLLDAELITVVRTRRVRAIDEKYYGRSARLFIWPSSDKRTSGVGFLGDALDDLDQAARRGDEGFPHLATARYARIPEHAAAEWSRRLSELADEFADQTRGGDTTFGLLIGLYSTERRPLPDDPEDET